MYNRKQFAKEKNVQSQQFTQALKIYTSRAGHAHDILHVWRPSLVQVYLKKN